MSSVESNSSQTVTPSSKEVERQLRRIFESPLFSRSARLQGFLGHICALAVRGEGDRINEYLIATEVFRRPANFASGEDSTVRRHAHLLRQKLQQYYDEEGRDDPLRIEVPVGHYVPTFQYRPVSRAVAGLRKIPRALTLAVLGLLLSASTFWIGRHSVQPDSAARLPLHPLLVRFWGPWLNAGQPVVLCLSNPLTAVIKRYPKPQEQTLGSPFFLAEPDQAEVIQRTFDLAPGGHISVIPNHSQIKKGEGFAAVKLASLFASGGVRVQVTDSDSLAWNDLRQNNAILFGNGDTNQWLDPLLENYPLQLRTHRGRTPRSIVSTGEPSGVEVAFSTEYPSVFNERRRDYALISLLPGLHPDHRLLLVNGLNHFATQAAIEYLTTPSDVESLLVALPDPTTNFFQMVLEVEVREGIPTRYRRAALEVIEPEPGLWLSSTSRLDQ